MAKTCSNYSVELIADRVTPINIEGEVYYIIPDRTYFKINLGNNTAKNIRAQAFLHGEKIGTWTIDPYSTILIERAMHINRLFMFYGEQSYGTYPENKDTGVLKVTFYPTKDTRTHWETIKPQCNPNNNNYLKLENYYFDGMLPLKSQDLFAYQEKPNLKDKDRSGPKKVYQQPDPKQDKIVTINMKIITDPRYIKPFVSVKEQAQTDYKYNPKQVPNVRQYDDFFVVNKYLPY